MKVVPLCDFSTLKPKELNNLLFYLQNIAGLSDQSHEEAIYLVEKDKVCLMFLQETWTSTSPDEYEFEDRHNGYLFLLWGIKSQKGREVETNVVLVSF